jgi:hypothetical protein
MMSSARWIGTALLAVMLVGSAAAKAHECDSSAPPAEGCHHHQLPLVFNVENTGASYPTPVFPSFAQLPIIRPLPDPFVSFNRSPRDPSFASWERRRNEIKAAIEKYEIGPKPAGKMALFAGAFDERVALTVAQENGGGGAPAWRRPVRVGAANHRRIPAVIRYESRPTASFGSNCRSLRRPWNIRVFTVLRGQPRVSAICWHVWPKR